MKPDLQGTRVMLRSLLTSDVDDLFEIYGSEVTMEFASDPVFQSIVTVYQLLDSVSRFEGAGESFEWAIEDVQTGKVIGTCGIHSFSMDRQTCEVGCLLNSNYWRKGYMSEALELVFGYAKLAGIKTILADIDALNFRSISFFTNLGFKQQTSGQYYLLLDN